MGINLRRYNSLKSTVLEQKLVLEVRGRWRALGSSVSTSLRNLMASTGVALLTSLRNVVTALATRQAILGPSSRKVAEVPIVRTMSVERGTIEDLRKEMDDFKSSKKGEVSVVQNEIIELNKMIKAFIQKSHSSRSPTRGACYEWGQTGHFAKECKSKGQSRSDQNPNWRKRSRSSSGSPFRSPSPKPTRQQYSLSKDEVESSKKSSGETKESLNC
jgi:hypothetical protein